MMSRTTSASQTTRPLPPGPKRHFLLGNLGVMSQDWLRFYRQCTEEHGDVVFLRFLHVPICAIVNPREIEYVLVTNAANFTKSADYRALARLLGKGLLTSEGPFWQHQRSLIQPAFRREKILSYAPVMTEAVARMLEGWRDHDQRNIHEDLMRVTLDIVARCLFGAEVSGAADRVGHAMAVVSERFPMDASWTLLFPFDIPDFLAPSRRRTIRELNDIIEGIIRGRRDSGKGRGDLLEALLEVRDARGEQMSATQLRDEMMTLFLAGHETTAIALSWACFLLAQHPDVEAQLVQELQTVLNGRMPSSDDLGRLIYTEMVVKEAMRLYPPVWAIGRRSIAECELAGYHVPAGTNIFIFQWLTQRDRRFFTDPERFDPERWRADPVRAGAVPRFAYLPFGAGPRTCVGASFAMLEATLLLAAILQRFHFDLVPNPPVVLQAAVTLRPKNGIHVVVRRRDGLSG
jgi:cytochrome P450